MLGGFSSKNSLVSFAPRLTPALPRTPKGWKDALAETKRLYLQRQYKQCAAMAEELLKTKYPPIHPIHQVFLNFYAAISYELLGQAAHLYSSTKVSFLKAALNFFVNCGTALPEPISLSKLCKAEETPSPSSPTANYPSTPCTPGRDLLAFDGAVFQSPERDSIIRSITRLIDVSLWNMEEGDPFISDDEDRDFDSPFMLSLSPLAKFPGKKTERSRLFNVTLSPTKTPALNKDEPIKRGPLMPSPLRVRKLHIPEDPEASLIKPNPLCISKSSSRSSRSLSQSPTRRRPPPLPLRIIPASRLNTINGQKSDKASPTDSIESCVNSKSSTGIYQTPPTPQTPQKRVSLKETTECMTPICAARIMRYNDGIEILRSQITANINSIQKHIDHVLEVQRVRRSRKLRRSTSFWSFSPISRDEADLDDQDREPPVLDEFGNILVKETKAQRIARLRSDQWKTVGLRSPRSTWKGSRYYQDFCAMVMNEMYLDQ